MFVGFFISLFIGGHGTPENTGINDPGGPSSTHIANYEFGTGISDITGDPVGDLMYGYANPSQVAKGIRLRVRARAFVVLDPKMKNRVAIVVVEAGGIMEAIRRSVINKLQTMYGDSYNYNNVLITATHTHSVPAGYSNDLIFDVGSEGYHKANFDSTVDGIVEAIVSATKDISPGEITLNEGDLRDASANRSRDAFEQDPDKSQYPDKIDTRMTQLTFTKNGKPVGLLNFFPVHGTSMSNSNLLISGDNKGYAAYHIEHDLEGVRYFEHNPGFVSAFAQSNAGDMSPNLDLKPGGLPENDESLNTQEIGLRQANLAIKLMNDPGEQLTGGLDYRQHYVDMSNVTVDASYTNDHIQHTTCPATIGASFTAGTDDGPGMPIFTQGITLSNEAITYAVKLLFQAFHADVPNQIRECQKPKQFLFKLGMVGPVEFSQDVLPLQLIRLGSLYLAAMPAEPTIMTGHRIRNTLAKTLNTDPKHVVVVGYSNAYSLYVTTPEEYDVQDYEGGATMFGKWTQPAYTQEFDKLAHDMKNGASSENGIVPPAPDNWILTLVKDVSNILDGIRLQSYQTNNQLIKDAQRAYNRGGKVDVQFGVSNPDINPRRRDELMEIQRQDDGGNWKTIATEEDWDTSLAWENGVATFDWTIPNSQSPGNYRISSVGVLSSDAPVYTQNFTIN